MAKYEYLVPNRLSDILGLISVLSIDAEWAYRPEDTLRKHLNGNPKSADIGLRLQKLIPNSSE
jgi:hypothetical protein